MKRKLMLALLAALTVVGVSVGGLSASAGPPYSCTTTTLPHGQCGPYPSYTGIMVNGSQPSGFVGGGIGTDQNDWSGSTPPTYAATLGSNSPGDWQIAATVNNPGGSVLSYPNAGWNMPASTVDSFPSTTTSWDVTMPNNGNVAIGWAAYDLWFNNWADEVFIATTLSVTPSQDCTTVAQTTINGQAWHLCDFGSERVVKPGTDDAHLQNLPSGTLDVKAVLDWLMQSGVQDHIPANSTWTAGSYGFEIPNTYGVQQVFQVNNLTFNAGTGGGGGGQAPVVNTEAATGITSSGATLHGNVNPEGAATTYQFEYGTSTAYGSVTPASPGSAGSGTSAVEESSAVTGLAASTTYHYRINATNATGTTHGGDQTFTTSAAGGGGTVGYDTTGPGVNGAKCANCASLSWSHTVNNVANRALVAGVAVGKNPDGACTLTVKDGATTMTPQATKHANNQTAGYEEVFTLVNPPVGTNTITATVTGCTPSELTGGSMGFTGVSQTSPFGTPATNAGSGTTASVNTPTAAGGGRVAAFAANGSPITSAGANTNGKFIANQDSATAAGNSAGAAPVGTSSPVSATWTVQSDWWAAIGVPVNPA